MSSLRMMKDGDEADTNVSWADQQNINKFSKLNSRLYALEEEYSEKKKRLELLEDVTSELELCDEDELVKYQVGDAFVNAPYSQVQEWLERDTNEATSAVEKLKDEMDGVMAKMDELKAILYKRFGNSINLERSE
ncbi:hypothetical protein AMAG_06183 [Allomyces macrogynus ATCC 38327]|uniref:Prefoldin subunit 4 n=1 Tax=Allomyces macrogynus (strain ATCC 38327) TaxID=578462 RepID=A0A0L0SFY5_ALLM3|nr:hypothetical protein AMAG_06183 [Allomyces macrogynus ATCC 38327]|eukprot:KNE61354.1 hypothetical protein AMAG_06183 [Allomyces macrogynus ATCC 38327]